VKEDDMTTNSSLTTVVLHTGFTLALACYIVGFFILSAGTEPISTNVKRDRIGVGCMWLSGIFLTLAGAFRLYAN